MNRMEVVIHMQIIKKAKLYNEIDIQIEDGIHIKKDTVKSISFKQAYHENFVH